MQDQERERNRRTPIGSIAAVAGVVLAVGGGAGWLAWNHFNSPTATVPTVAPSAQPILPVTEQKAQVYWLNNVNNKIEVVPIPITVKNADQPEEIIEAALNSLLLGPVDKGLATTIPKGTQLKEVSLQADGIHIDLSKQFTTGGGSASMTGRVAQILYTASSLDPTAKVWLKVEGKPLEVLGGEGLELDQPITRENFKKNFAL
ncbi:GerMN domain-containing protein [Microcoleus sp. herbarium7]|uniref:GerMN domain-containing protein n=1 Tax=Microcoleus sp. herbarium7 TaxID=3055435 RepID=UPI002FD22B37